MAFEDLAPGDVVLVTAGDLIPCDGRILEADDFFLNQALLTGESYPVEKKPGELPEEKDLLSAGNSVLIGPGLSLFSLPWPLRSALPLSCFP